MERQFQGKIEEAKKELEDFKTTARETEKNLNEQVRTGNDQKAKANEDHAEQIERASTELNDVRESRDTAVQEKNKLESFQDGQKSEIERLETDLVRAREDVDCRKLIIDEMSKSMLGHEHESMEMAQKLTLMKNQIMEDNAAGGMMHRYAAVRLGTIRHHPCTVSQFSFILTLFHVLGGICERGRFRLFHGNRWKA